MAFAEEVLIDGASLVVRRMTTGAKGTDSGVIFWFLAVGGVVCLAAFHASELTAAEILGVSISLASCTLGYPGRFARGLEGDFCTEQ